MLPPDWSLTRVAARPPIDERWIANLLAARHAREQQRPPRTSLWARLCARALGARLDRALIAGADPARSQRLAARAALLTSPRTRSELADGLELLLASAKEPPRRRLALPRHDSILANSNTLRELAALLRSPRPLYAPGIALVHRLLTDGTGPLYLSRDGAALECELEAARAALRG